jgi:hypothetical protein
MGDPRAQKAADHDSDLLEENGIGPLVSGNGGSKQAG